MSQSNTRGRGTILLVSEERPLSRVIEGELRGLVDRVACLSPKEATAERVGAEGVSLVLIDLEGDHWNDFALTRALKESPLTRALPILHLVARRDAEGITRGYEAGAFDYLPKPLVPATLRARVRSALQLDELTRLLEARAQIDVVAGIGNQEAFYRELNQSIADGEDGLVSLLSISGLEWVNEEFGYQQGDRLIHEIGGMLLESTRLRGRAYRLGGSSFALVLPRDLDDAAPHPESLARAVERLACGPDTTSCALRCSWGSARIAEHEDARHILGAARRDLRRREPAPTSQV